MNEEHLLHDCPGGVRDCCSVGSLPIQSRTSLGKDVGRHLLLATGSRYVPPHQFPLSFTATNDIIEEATYSGIIDPSAERHTLNHRGPKARLTYSVRVK